MSINNHFWDFEKVMLDFFGVFLPYQTPEKIMTIRRFLNEIIGEDVEPLEHGDVIKGQSNS